MNSKKFKHMSKDEVFERWQQRFDRILTELMYPTRRKFWDIQEMFKTNEKLYAIGSQPYEWILGIWGRDAVMGIRRELDDDRNTIALGSMLDEMTERPQVLNRRRFLSFLRPNEEEYIIRVNNEAFDNWGTVKRSGGSLEDYLDLAGIKADREALDATAKPVLEYANRLVAHRTPIDKLGLTIGEINKAIDAFEPIVQKYHVILTGKALAQIEPSNVGDDWKEVFTFPWYIPRMQ